MGLGFLTRGMTIPLRKLLAVTILFSTSFAWFFAFFNVWDDIFIVFNTDWFWINVGYILFIVSVAISAFIGSAIAGKIDRRRMLFLWLVFSIFTILPIPFLRGPEFLIIMSIFAGVGFGIGFPSCMAFIGDSTIAEERGRVTGFVILVTFFLVFLSVAVNATLGFTSLIDPPRSSYPMGLIMTGLVIKLVGFSSFVLDPIQKKNSSSKSWRKIFAYRDFNLYTLAFVFFMIAAGLVFFLLGRLLQDPLYEQIGLMTNQIRFLSLAFFGVAAGVAADRIGRKKPVILGLIMLGAGYTTIGLMTNTVTFTLHLLLSGFAWGILIVIYLIIPGDLAFSGSEERFYAAGWVLPLMVWIGVTGALRFGPPFPSEIGIYSFILSILIYISIIPIWSAAETLSESKMRQRRFKEYTEKIGKVIQESKEGK